MGRLLEVVSAMAEETEEIERAFKIVDSDGDGKISQSELHLYLFGLGCNLTKKQMNECPTSCDEATARAKFEEYKPEEVVSEAELQGIFNTWDDKNTGEVSWKQITTPVGDGDDICPFPDDVNALFRRILGEDLKGTLSSTGNSWASWRRQWGC